MLLLLVQTILILRITKVPHQCSPHEFYIPVMGTGFTVNTPAIVAQFGIDSTISLVDDELIEKMRKLYTKKFGIAYEEITNQEEDSRARRITAYLNLLQDIVMHQITQLKQSLFTPDSDLERYFEMLPKNSPLKKSYQAMLAEKDEKQKRILQIALCEQIIPGSIDVNIMTKMDGQSYSGPEALPYELSDAAAALRGYAKSNLSSSVILSAGFNPYLYGYMTQFDDFFPTKENTIKKKIVLKVSDLRSAIVQGKYLAKRGLWVTEYRIESPLNCGGHAFINDGQLLGPILAEFKQRKQELQESLHALYHKALNSLNRFCPDEPREIYFAAQGGIGTHQEQEFLLRHYDLRAVGWGTPFLLVPEVTNVDSEQLLKLINAKPGDVFLSASSPLGVPFWNLRNSSSELARCERIKAGKPGSICTNGHAKLNSEFTTRPICRASYEYQQYKLKELRAKQAELPAEKFAALEEDVINKSCICRDLAGGALIKYDIDTKATAAICPGPNIINFKKIATLRQMIDHIYGRASLLTNDEDRPHMFLQEIRLQIDYFLDELKNTSLGLPVRSQQKLALVKENLLEGMRYYQEFAKKIFQDKCEKALEMLKILQAEVESIP